MRVCFLIHIGVILLGELIIFLFNLTRWSAFGDAEGFETTGDCGGEVVDGLGDDK